MAAVTRVLSSAGNNAMTSADAPVALALAADSRHIAHKFLLRGEKIGVKYY